MNLFAKMNCQCHLMYICIIYWIYPPKCNETYNMYMPQAPYPWLDERRGTFFWQRQTYNIAPSPTIFNLIPRLITACVKTYTCTYTDTIINAFLYTSRILSSFCIFTEKMHVKISYHMLICRELIINLHFKLRNIFLVEMHHEYNATSNGWSTHYAQGLWFIHYLYNINTHNMHFLQSYYWNYCDCL